MHVVTGEETLGLVYCEAVLKEIVALCVFEESLPVFGDDEAVVVYDPLVLPELSRRLVTDHVCFTLYTTI